MNKLLFISIALLGSVSLRAQELSSDNKEDILSSISINVLEVNRVEKYGWDQLEVLYNLQNNSDFTIKKLDFIITLQDEEGNEVGTVDGHAFNIPEATSRDMKYFDVGSQYVNAKINSFSAKTILLDVVVDDESQKVVSIKNTTLAQR